jgi:hypothetical protein
VPAHFISGITRQTRFEAPDRLSGFVLAEALAALLPQLNQHEQVTDEQGGQLGRITLCSL